MNASTLATILVPLLLLASTGRAAAAEPAREDSRADSPEDQPEKSQGAAPSPPSPGTSPAPPQDPREAARVRFAQGLERAGQSDYEGALREFTAAYELSPHFAVLYNIGQSLIALGRPLEAVDTLSKYLRDGQEQVPPDRRLQAETQISLLQSLFAELTITTDRPGALISVDGREVGRTPLYQPLRLAAGTHAVSAVVEAPGGTTTTNRTVTIMPGERQVLRLGLPAPATIVTRLTEPPPRPPVPAPDVVAASAPPRGGAGPRTTEIPGGPSSTALVDRPQDARPESRWRTTTAVVCAVVGAGLGGAALFVYLRNRGRYRDWQNEDAALAKDKGGIDYYPRQAANNQLADSLTRDNHLTVGLAVAGGALLAGGIASFLLDRPNGGRAEGHRAALLTGFTVGLGSQGLASGNASWSASW
jgi:tetratricopeptide (TPR) repeat protein